MYIKSEGSNDDRTVAKGILVAVPVRRNVGVVPSASLHRLIPPDDTH